MDANLQGSIFKNSEAQGAIFDGAKLQGASFANASAQGASFERSELHCTSFKAAQLQGATFFMANLQGALLEQANLTATNLGSSSVWRVKGTPYLSLAVAFQLDTNRQPWKQMASETQTFEKWRDFLLADIPAGKYRDVLNECFPLLDPATKNKTQLLPATFWTSAVADWEKGKTDGGKRDAEFVDVLTDLACSEDSPPYIARNLIERVSGAGASVFGRRLRQGKIDINACPGVKGFTNSDWANLQRYVPVH